MKFRLFVLCFVTVIVAIVAKDTKDAKDTKEVAVDGEAKQNVIFENACANGNSANVAAQIEYLKQISNQIEELQNAVDQCNARNVELCQPNPVLPGNSSSCPPESGGGEGGSYPEICGLPNPNNHPPSSAPFFDIRVEPLPQECITDSYPKDCAEATACTKRNGIYLLSVPKYSPEPFYAECKPFLYGGGWTVIQRRQDGSVDFFRNFTDYKDGFGIPPGEFFIGLDKLHFLTTCNGPQELLVALRSQGETRIALYDNFAVGPECDGYPLKCVGSYCGDAGDSLSEHVGNKFSTKDQDNDVSEENCAQIYKGGWWYKKCHISNLNGRYGANNPSGIIWSTFRGFNTSIEHVIMMIRRRQS